MSTRSEKYIKLVAFFGSYENCKIEALKFRNRTEFYRKSRLAYTIAVKNGWIDEFHQTKNNIIKKINLNDCIEKIKECKTVYEFKKRFYQYYTASINNNWYDDLKLIINSRLKKNNGYWTKEQCQNVALKCEYRKEFQIKFHSAYSKALKNNWLDEICSHMSSIGDKYRRCVYVFEFKESKTCYVGLTCNLIRRAKTHMLKGPVHDFIKNNNESFELKQLSDYIKADKAQTLEGKYLERYKNNGWVILNSIKAGGLGGLSTNKYDINKCRVLALECKTRWEFNQKYNKEYQACLKNNWLDEICSHMVEKKKNRYWDNFERCLEVAKKCKNKTEFIKKYDSAYRYSKKNDWINKLKFK